MNISLIADSGSTKTDWLITDGTHEQRLQTTGINPVVQDEQTIQQTLRTMQQQLGEPSPTAIHFYGAGMIDPYRLQMARRLHDLFPTATVVEAESDLLGAARAVCQYEAGIACILGTGSNSCLYDGNAIVSNVPPLGFILGDEGSGAHLGKLFLNALLKGDLPPAMLSDFYATMHLTYPDIIRRVYREPLPNRFLASTSLYIRAHVDEEPVRQLVVSAFRSFFDKNVAKYCRPDLTVSAVGSIAHAYADLFREAAAEAGFRIGHIMKSPIEGLRHYAP